jgi:hypothetical protein
LFSIVSTEAAEAWALFVVEPHPDRKIAKKIRRGKLRANFHLPARAGADLVNIPLVMHTFLKP